MSQQIIFLQHDCFTNHVQTLNDKQRTQNDKLFAKSSVKKFVTAVSYIDQTKYLDGAGNKINLENLKK